MAKTATTTENMNLPKEIFEVPMNTNLLHQVITSQTSNRRQVIASAKNRAEVSGGGIKPWKQKGTGRARHGSNTSPIWIGGGVTHGPRKERNYKKSLPKNIKRKALFIALSEKARQGLLNVVPSFDIKEAKTKIAREFLKNNGVIGSCLVVLGTMDKNVILSMRNMPKIKTIQAKDLNCLDVLTYKNMLTTADGINEIKKTFLGE